MVDQSLREAEPPELTDLVDPTEDLANEVTSELPGPGTRLRIVTPSLIGGDVIMANEATIDVASVMTTGAVLRDRYVLGQPLGYGGTSVVFQAHDLRRAEVAAEGADVAIKLLRPEFRDRPRCIARLKREFQQTQSIVHPNVVRFYDLDCDRGTWFIAMEALVGESVGWRLRHQSPAGLPAAEALRIAADCGEALAHAHDHGITHGDVKPDNVFVTESGGVRVLDFGVAPESLQPQDWAIPDPLRGAATRAYASPEVLSGQSPESRDDVFSLACLIYEMLAGRHPYGRRGADEARGARLQVEPLSGICVHQWHALAAGMAWRREDRPDIRELLRALRNEAPAPAAVEAQTLAPAMAAAVLPVQVVESKPPRRLSPRWALPAVICLAVVLGVLIGWFAFDSQSDSRNAANDPPLTVGSKAAIPAVGGVTSTTDADGLNGLTPAIPQPAAAPAVALGARTPLAPGLVAFDAGTMIVSRRAVVAPIPVRHSSTVRRSVTVAWRVVDGSAVAGRDYGGVQSGVAHFSEGHTFRMIYVPIVANSNAAGDRSFTVELSNASSGASLGITDRIVVTILGDA